ncbi:MULTISPECIES: dihydrofolate reductase family protein [unclassified Corynebacterium]|uniref:dihydrofolate reductase family protein n=2 Tax=unclassified Corynebacterium TaxID=2624378 RepID=UPI000551D5EC
MPLREISSLLGPEPTGEVVLRAIMASTLSGSATINNRSKEMGNKTDGQLLTALRDWADAVLVGGNTVRSENYFGVRKSLKDDRPAPMVVPSRSLKYDVTTQFFTNFYTAPIFLVPDIHYFQLRNSGVVQQIIATGAEVIDAGEGTMQDYLRVLRQRGFQRILCEGGPGMIGQLVHIDAIDQMYLTLDPHLSTGVEKPVATFHGTHSHRRMQLDNVAADTDSTVFLRYSRTVESVD